CRDQNAAHLVPRHDAAVEFGAASFAGDDDAMVCSTLETEFLQVSDGATADGEPRSAIALDDGGTFGGSEEERGPSSVENDAFLIGSIARECVHEHGGELTLGYGLHGLADAAERFGVVGATRGSVDDKDICGGETRSRVDVADAALALPVLCARHTGVRLHVAHRRLARAGPSVVRRACDAGVLEAHRLRRVVGTCTDVVFGA